MIINTKTISTNYLDKNKNKKGKDDIKKDAHERIMEIKKNKKQMKIIIKIEEMTLSIKKIHPDLQIENFLESLIISPNVNQWINLIFWLKTKGKRSR